MTERVIPLIQLSLKEPLIQSFLKNKLIKKLHALAERFVCFCCNQAPENGTNKKIVIHILEVLLTADHTKFL